MAGRRVARSKGYGARFRTVALGEHFNWPTRTIRAEWWQELARRVRDYPQGEQRPWGIPFAMGTGRERRVILVCKNSEEVTIAVRAKADYVCYLHQWWQLPEDVNQEDPSEGLVVGEYELAYVGGEVHAQPVRGRFEVPMAESPARPGWRSPSTCGRRSIPSNTPRMWRGAGLSQACAALAANRSYARFPTRILTPPLARSPSGAYGIRPCW